MITFKVDRALRDALEGMPNRSEFIRNAVLAALDSTCPVCRGRGILSANQQRHWQAFAETHSLEKCGSCEELHLVCAQHPCSDRHLPADGKESQS